MYHVSAQGVDERMVNVHYYYYVQGLLQPKEPAGQFTVSMFRDCYRGARWTGSLLSVHVQEQAVY